MNKGRLRHRQSFIEIMSFYKMLPPYRHINFNMPGIIIGDKQVIIFEVKLVKFIE